MTTDTARTPPEVEARTSEILHELLKQDKASHIVLDVTIPDLPPSINDMYATVNGRRVKSAEARAFGRTVEAAILTTYRYYPTVPANKKLKFSIACYYPTHMPDGKRSGQLKLNDSDGRLKAGKDSVFTALGIKDNKVYEDATLKAHGTPGLLALHPGGYCRVTLTVIGDL